jgi:16S rRNA (cytosine967-C5)-methyltransferase
VTLLRAVLAHGRPLEDAFEHDPAVAALGSRDRAFARLLAATVLRRLGQLDALIGAALAHRLPRRAVGVRDVLRLGAAQLLFLGTPAHAAVATAVALAEADGLGAYKGLVNAVLRRLGREGPDRLAAQDAARLNTPDWLWRAWGAAYGRRTARAIAAAHLEEAPLDLSVKADAADAAAWADRLGAALLASGTLRRPAGGLVPELPGYAEGAWWVQDAGAALPARLFGDVAGRPVIDLCAAPGGKTAQLAAAGAQVTAVDRSADRLATVRRNLDRLGLDAGLVAADAADWEPPAPAPFVLLDAPCTSTGTIRRHPDIQRLKGPDDVAALAEVQARLLTRAGTMTAPGGLLVYCTCSLQPEEGRRQIEAFLAAGAPFRREPIRAEEIGGLADAVLPDGDAQTLPCHAADRGGVDGFFISRLRRVG